MTEYLGVVGGVLDMVRDENVLLESELDPEFRVRVGEEVRRVRGGLAVLGDL